MPWVQRKICAICRNKGRPARDGTALKMGFPTRPLIPCSATVDPAEHRRDVFDLQKPLEQFRARTKRLKVHPAETRVLWLVCLHLVFLPWALGGMRLWAQCTSLGLALLGFVFALVPRDYNEEHTGVGSFRLIMWPKVLRFPIFWIGAALLVLLTVQGLNPAWTYVTDGKNWWMQQVEHIRWLPAGVDVPFERWGPWRMLLIYASVWLTVCTVWIAFTRRRTVQRLLVTLCINGLLLAGFGVAQRLLGNGKIFWFYNSPNPSFFSSFIYKNHGGAYLLLALTVTCGLAGWYYLRGQRRLEKSNPSAVLAFFATCIAVSILTSYARGATLTMLAFLLGCIGAFIAHQFLGPSENRKPVVAIVLVLIFGFFLKTGFHSLRSGEAWDRIHQGLTRQDASLEAREHATRASLEMLREQGVRGVGAGSFRFIFPIYQHRDPALVSHDGRRMFWEHAHNDVLQIPIELGAAGTLLIVLSIGYWFVRLIRSYFWANPLSACIVFGALLLVVYSWWDFPFQNPAILATWCVLWPVAATWAKLEEGR